ncbi:MAG: hypothetical protein Kow0089_12990 [Desulfobulbaceae bacterium]
MAGAAVISIEFEAGIAQLAFFKQEKIHSGEYPSFDNSIEIRIQYQIQAEPGRFHLKP